MNHSHKSDCLTFAHYIFLLQYLAKFYAKLYKDFLIHCPTFAYLAPPLHVLPHICTFAPKVYILLHICKHRLSHRTGPLHPTAAKQIVPQISLDLHLKINFTPLTLNYGSNHAVTFSWQWLNFTLKPNCFDLCKIVWSCHTALNHYVDVEFFARHPSHGMQQAYWPWEDEWWESKANSTGC